MTSAALLPQVDEADEETDRGRHIKVYSIIFCIGFGWSLDCFEQLLSERSVAFLLQDTLAVYICALQVFDLLYLVCKLYRSFDTNNAHKCHLFCKGRLSSCVQPRDDVGGARHTGSFANHKETWWHLTHEFVRTSVRKGCRKCRKAERCSGITLVSSKWSPSRSRLVRDKFSGRIARL